MSFCLLFLLKCYAFVIVSLFWCWSSVCLFYSPHFLLSFKIKLLMTAFCVCFFWGWKNVTTFLKHSCKDVVILIELLTVVCGSNVIPAIMHDSGSAKWEVIEMFKVKFKIFCVYLPLGIVRTGCQKHQMPLFKGHSEISGWLKHPISVIPSIYSLCSKFQLALIFMLHGMRYVRFDNINYCFIEYSNFWCPDIRYSKMQRSISILSKVDSSCGSPCEVKLV